MVQVNAKERIVLLLSSTMLLQQSLVFVDSFSPTASHLSFDSTVTNTQSMKNSIAGTAFPMIPTSHPQPAFVACPRLFSSLVNNDDFDSSNGFASPSFSPSVPASTSLFSSFSNTNDYQCQQIQKQPITKRIRSTLHRRMSNTMLKLSSTVRSKQDLQRQHMLTNKKHIVPFSLSIAKKTLSQRNSIRCMKKRAALSSIILFAQILHYENSEGDVNVVNNDPNLDFDVGFDVTTITHTSRLSDNSTFEFERREHTEVTENQIAESASLFESVYTNDMTEMEVDTDDGHDRSIDTSFVQNQFEQGKIDIFKEHLDQINHESSNEKTNTLEVKKAEMIDLYSQSSDAGDRAFAILLKLNMVEIHLDPEDPHYDHNDDDAFVLQERQ